MAIFKATITVTVFLQSDDEQQARNTLGQFSLATLAEEMDDGQMVGDHQLMSVTAVPSDKLQEELLAIGSNEDFFAPDEE